VIGLKNVEWKGNEMSLKIPVVLGRLMVVMAFVLVGNVAGYGQGLGAIEAAGHLGIVDGIGSHGSFGGSLGAPLTENLAAFADLSYIPMGGSRVTVFGSTMSASAKAFNFNGTLHYQFKPTRAVVPYVCAGLGFLHSSFESSNTGLGSNSFSVSGGSTDMYFNVGGGFRYYVRERWGFRPEFMVFAGSNTYVRLAGGIFYQFGE
jgi:hypothetical protein